MMEEPLDLSQPGPSEENIETPVEQLGNVQRASRTFCPYIAVNGNLELSDSVNGMISVNGNAEITDNITGVTCAKNVRINDAVIGILVSRQAQLTGDNQILLDTRQALAFGAAFGAVFALLGWLLRKKKL